MRHAGRRPAARSHVRVSVCVCVCVLCAPPRCASAPPPPLLAELSPTPSSASPALGGIAPAQRCYARFNVACTKNRQKNATTTKKHTYVTFSQWHTHVLCIPGSHANSQQCTSVPVGGAPAPGANSPGAYALRWGPRPSDLHV